LSVRYLRTPLVALAAAALAGACGPASTSTGLSPVPAPAPPPAAPPVYVPLTPGLPPIPAVEGTLAIRLVAPEPGQSLPRRDSTFLYGSVGTGGAALTVDGTPVPVAPNGAFIAYLPVPADGVWRLEAAKGAERASTTYTYRPRAAAQPSRADTATEAGTGADTAAARPAPAAAPAASSARKAVASAPAEPAPAASSNVELKKGMTEAEVVRALGQPRRKIGLGERTVWSYDGFSVTFSGGKVSELN